MESWKDAGSGLVLRKENTSTSDCAKQTLANVFINSISANIRLLLIIIAGSYKHNIQLLAGRLPVNSSHRNVPVPPDPD
jgi:hypothetical protein